MRTVLQPDNEKIFRTQMSKVAGTVLQARQKIVMKQAGVNLSGYFVHSCLELM